MSSVQFHCPLCSGLFEVDESFAGMEVTCPHCEGVVGVPEMGPAEPPPPPEPAIQPTAFELNCPFCNGLFQATTEMANQEVLCPHCQQAVTVPELEAPPSHFIPPPPPVYEQPPVYVQPPPPPPVQPVQVQPVRVVQPVMPVAPVQPAPVMTPPVGPATLPYIPPPSHTPVPKTELPSSSTKPSTLEKKTSRSDVSKRPLPAPVAPIPVESIAPRPTIAPEPVISAPSPQSLLPPGATSPDTLLPPRGGDGPANMLPPGAESLLPPGASAATMDAERKPLPMMEQEPNTITIPGGPAGQPVKIRDREIVKTIHHKGQVVELRQLTPEEKAQRKLIRNIIMMVACLALLSLVTVLLVWKKKK